MGLETNSGGPFAKQYEVCVEVEAGQPGSTKIENMAAIFKPTETGMAKVRYIPLALIFL